MKSVLSFYASQCLRYSLNVRSHNVPEMYSAYDHARRQFERCMRRRTCSLTIAQ